MVTINYTMYSYHLNTVTCIQVVIVLITVVVVTCDSQLHML